MKEAAEHLRCAVQALRRAGYQDYLCRGLLAWVELHTLTGDLVQARRELDQVFAVTSRCGFRLYEADAYLALASIALAEDDRGAAKKSLVLARQLAMPAGYHRRRAEIARLERALA